MLTALIVSGCMFTWWTNIDRSRDSAGSSVFSFLIKNTGLYIQYTYSLFFLEQWFTAYGQLWGAERPPAFQLSLFHCAFRGSLCLLIVCLGEGVDGVDRKHMRWHRGCRWGPHWLPLLKDVGGWLWLSTGPLLFLSARSQGSIQLKLQDYGPLTWRFVYTVFISTLSLGQYVSKLGCAGRLAWLFLARFQIPV